MQVAALRRAEGPAESCSLAGAPQPGGLLSAPAAPGQLGLDLPSAASREQPSWVCTATGGGEGGSAGGSGGAGGPGGGGGGSSWESSSGDEGGDDELLDLQQVGGAAGRGLPRRRRRYDCIGQSKGSV